MVLIPYLVWLSQPLTEPIEATPLPAQKSEKHQKQLFWVHAMKGEGLSRVQSDPY